MKDDDTTQLEEEIRETINRFRSKLNSDIMRAYNEAASCGCAHTLRMQNAIDTRAPDPKNILKPGEKVLCFFVLVAIAMAVYVGFKARFGQCGCGCLGDVTYF